MNQSAKYIKAKKKKNRKKFLEHFLVLDDQQKADNFTNQLINKNRLITFQHHRVDAKQLKDALHIAATLFRVINSAYSIS